MELGSYLERGGGGDFALWLRRFNVVKLLEWAVL